MTLTLKQRIARRLAEIMRTNVSLDTQVKVSRRTKLSQSTVGRLLNQEQDAGLSVVEQLGHGLGMHRPEYLFLADDEIALLEAWGKLGQDERIRILGYIEINAQMQSQAGTMPWSQTRRIGANERDAQQAAARYSAPDLKLSHDVNTPKSARGRPPKRST